MLFSEEKWNYDLVFILLFSISLPFPQIFSNMVITAYSVVVIVSFAKRIPNRYAFDTEALKKNIGFLLLFSMLLLSGLYSDDKATWWHQIEKLSALLILPLYFCFVSFTKREKLIILGSFVAANLAALLFHLAKAVYQSVNITNNRVNFDASVSGGQDFWYSIAQGGNYFFYDQLADWIHPSYWAIYLLVSLPMLLDLLSQNRDKKTQIFGIASCLLLVAGIFLSSSRIVLYTVSLLIVIWLIKKVLERKNVSQASTIGAVFFLAISLSLVVAHPRSKEFLDVGAIFSNQKRTTIWQSSIEVIRSSLFWGQGLGDSENALLKTYQKHAQTENYSRNYNEHNQYLNILSSVGLIGFLCLIYIFFAGFKASLANRDFVQFCFIFSVAVICFVENFLMRRAGFVFFSFFYGLLFSPPRKQD
jgi:O-antigen ligase